MTHRGEKLLHLLHITNNHTIQSFIIKMNITISIVIFINNAGNNYNYVKRR